MSYRLQMESFYKKESRSSVIEFGHEYATKKEAYEVLHKLAQLNGKEILEDKLWEGCMIGGNPVWNHYFVLIENERKRVTVFVTEEL